ncbi:TPM domain-containing protein [Dinghuibacter silviterrae]|uniref:TPM domain-containing protein n=1 Tax=Dinghuibacter silviterrae TaxID=1539049 RepID=A0A4R8DM12_9BACT|nr:TPM domain-containing protein [Dinghuibacter silviterrae]TDW98999.1 uncharacterized protein EDB95_0005 [Dinghuibacter silviterrae]
MKYLLTILLGLSLFTGLRAQDIPPRPNPPKLVNDLAGILNPGLVQDLETRLDAYDDSTSVQIAVVTIPSTNGYDPVDYAVKLGRTWGVGNKQTNNGVVFLIARDDHKVFIAPGYGLEGALPDITCKEIVDNQVLPYFKQGDYNTGVDSGVNAIILAAKGEYKAPAGYHEQGKGAGAAVVFLVIAFIVLIIIIRSRGSGPGGGFISRRGYGVGPFLWGAAAGSIFGGGGSGGSSSGGGGGGFGGFGGGSFGGGGAGGSW